MFGLMKACSCNKSAQDRELRRMHYCGTCKTIGRLYGQKARVFLNYDAVFLGEILGDLQPTPIQFAQAYTSKNCLALPSEHQIPWSLEYAASANVVLAQFKLLDHVADTGSKLIGLAVRAYSKEFLMASQALSKCQFPFTELKRLMSLQSEREREAIPQLSRLSEPTAGATRLVFQHGSVTVGASESACQTMGRLGSVFGEIAYLADAIQDRDQDASNGEFNALTATGIHSVRARKLLRGKQDEMVALLAELPIDDTRRQAYTARLRANLNPLLFRRQRRGQVVTVSRRRTCFWDDCCCECLSDIACCEAMNCCECLGSGCCECACAGC